jgi:hypothetical protein
MKWKNPAELGKLGFRLRGVPTPADPEVEYELCLLDDENAVALEIRILFNQPYADRPLTPGLEGGPFVYAGAELRLYKLRREHLTGPLLRGPFVAARPLFFDSFQQVEAFVSALTGATPLFPDDQEPFARDRRPWTKQDLYHSAHSALVMD